MARTWCRLPHFDSGLLVHDARDRKDDEFRFERRMAGVGLRPGFGDKSEMSDCIAKREGPDALFSDTIKRERGVIGIDKIPTIEITFRSDTGETSGPCPNAGCQFLETAAPQEFGTVTWTSTDPNGAAKIIYECEKTEEMRLHHE
jgi:hypothetical protein